METAAAVTNYVDSAMVLEALGFSSLIMEGITNYTNVQDYTYCLQSRSISQRFSLTLSNFASTSKANTTSNTTTGNSTTTSGGGSKHRRSLLGWLLSKVTGSTSAGDDGDLYNDVSKEGTDVTSSAESVLTRKGRGLLRGASGGSAAASSGPTGYPINVAGLYGLDWKGYALVSPLNEISYEVDPYTRVSGAFPWPCNPSTMIQVAPEGAGQGCEHAERVQCGYMVGQLLVAYKHLLGWPVACNTALWPKAGTSGREMPCSMCLLALQMCPAC
jgi:hypothetical protein